MHRANRFREYAFVGSLLSDGMHCYADGRSDEAQRTASATHMTAESATYFLI